MALRLIRRAGAGRERLRAWRRRAQAARRASPLFDTRRAVRGLEAGLRIAWDAAMGRASEGDSGGGGGTFAPAGWRRRQQRRRLRWRGRPVSESGRRWINGRWRRAVR